MSQDDLITFLFDDSAHPLVAYVALWLTDSRRFKVFVIAFRTKIRKKLRGARDPESVRDLRLELETAYLLLTEKALSLVYEPPAEAGTRGPDFAVTLTSGTTFMVEVTRLRSAAHQASQTILLRRAVHRCSVPQAGPTAAAVRQPGSRRGRTASAVGPRPR